MDTEAIVTDLKNVLKAHRVSGNVEVQEYNIFDGYYEKHRDIFNSSECWYENVETDRVKQLTHDREVDFLADAVLGELADGEDIVEILQEILDEYGVSPNLKPGGEEITLADFTVAMVDNLLSKQQYRLFKEKVWDFIAESWDWDEAMSSGLFDEDALMDSTDPIEALAYWTVYFEPRTFDEDVAHECRLVPFQWRPRETEDLDLLALGGCGMDMSPKLDAYQALVDGTLPSGSMLLSGINRDYCVSMLGETTYKKALAKAKLKSPAIILRTY